MMMRNMTRSGSKTKRTSSVPIKSVCTTSGFVLGPDGSLLKSARPIRIEIERLRLIIPSQVRELLENEKSLDEIKAFVERDANPSFIYRGKIWLDGMAHSLVGLDLTYESNETILNADVAEIQEDIWFQGSSSIIGHIKAKEGVWGTKGELEIDKGPLSGSYKLFLNSTPERWGQ